LKLKELLTLVLIGLGLGAALAWVALRNRPPSPPQVPAESLRIDPRWSRLNPTAFDEIAYVYQKTFSEAEATGFQPREARPVGRALAPGETLAVEVPTQKATLGLVIEARASTPGLEVPRFRSPIHREGVNLKPGLPAADAPRLQVTWDHARIAVFPLETLYWRWYYARVDGDGKAHRLTLEVEPAEGGSRYEAAVKQVSLFSQDAEETGSWTRIGPAEAALRAEALRRNIVILGLDGISWRIVEPLIEQGRLPNLQRLIEQGARATLVDEPPLDSAKIWTTIATGRHPAAHGLDKRVYRSPDSADPIPVNSTLRRTKALWNQFSDLGRTVGFVNWFVSWPAERVNGFVVSDRARFSVSHAVYPEVLGQGRERFLATESDLAQDSSAFADRVRELRETLRAGNYPARNEVERQEFAALVKRLEEVYFNDCFFRNYGLALYREHRPNLFALYFHGPDAISHAFYKFHFPEESVGVTAEQRQVIGDTLEAIYCFHDRTLGELMQAAEPDTTWAVLSDHGFQAQPVELEKIYIWDLDSLLKELGLLHYQEGAEIDWTRTACYTARQLEWNPVAFLRLNVEGRESEGIVAREQFESRLEQVAQQLRQITLERSGRPVFRVEVETEARRHGRYDLRVEPVLEPEDFADRIMIAGRRVPPAEIFTIVPLSGTHEIEGVLVLSGPGVRPGVRLDTVRTVDIAPTLLALAGLPLGEDFDGRVIEEALQPDFLQQVPVRTLPSYEWLGRSLQEAGDPAGKGHDEWRLGEVEGQMLDHMRGFGYLR